MSGAVPENPWVCAFDPCDNPSAAQVQWVDLAMHGRMVGAVVVRGLAEGDEYSLPYCVDHTHWLVDTVLMKSLPEPLTDKEP